MRRTLPDITPALSLALPFRAGDALTQALKRGRPGALNARGLTVGLTPAALDGDPVLGYALDALPQPLPDGSTVKGVLLRRL